MSRIAISLRIEGRVQGVGYRWWAVDAARKFGLSGWARNRVDGSVEILAIGDPGVIERLAEACARGPPAAEVARVSRTPAHDDGSRDFRQAPTL